MADAGMGTCSGGADVGRLVRLAAEGLDRGTDAIAVIEQLREPILEAPHDVIVGWPLIHDIPPFGGVVIAAAPDTGWSGSDVLGAATWAGTTPRLRFSSVPRRTRSERPGQRSESRARPALGSRSPLNARTQCSVSKSTAGAGTDPAKALGVAQAPRRPEPQPGLSVGTSPRHSRASSRPARNSASCGRQPPLDPGLQFAPPATRARVDTNARTLAATRVTVTPVSTPMCLLRDLGPASTGVRALSSRTSAPVQVNHRVSVDQYPTAAYATS